MSLNHVNAGPTSSSVARNSGRAAHSNSLRGVQLTSGGAARMSFIGIRYGVGRSYRCPALDAHGRGLAGPACAWAGLALVKRDAEFETVRDAAGAFDEMISRRRRA